MTDALRNEPSESRLELELDPSPEAPAIARAAVKGFTSTLELESAALATLQLLVSEIVTNAVIHPKTQRESKIALRAWLAAGVLRVEVVDQGIGFAPAPRDPARAAGGYGIFLLDKQATRWGIERRCGTVVWFELAA
jgi:anti-sigma regulatory factor (Ser/Thr protein kinase)